MKLLNVSRSLIVLASVGALFAQPPAGAPQPPKPSIQPAPPVAAPVKPGTPAPAAVEVAPGTVVLMVGDEKLTRAQFEDVLAALADNGRPATTPQAKRQVAEQLAELKAVAAEARKRKLDQTGPVKQMMSIQQDSVLANALGKQLNNDIKPDETAERSYYEKNKGQYEQAKASHILIRFQGSRVPLKPNQKDLTKEEALAKAKEIREKLVKGEDFAAAAKAESDDPGSGANGGSLGVFGKGQMVPQFEQAAFSLPVGQISEPVESPFGYHIIKVEERTSKSFEQARPEIEKQLKPQMVKDAMEKFRKETPVTLDENYFGK